MAVLLLIATGTQLINPQILKLFINTVLEGGTSSALLIAAVFFIGVALINLIVSVIANSLVTNVAWTATNLLRKDLINHCLSLDMKFHTAHTPGELIERIDGDVDALSNFFSEFIINLLTNLLLMLGVLVFFFLINWFVGIAGIAYSVFAFFLFKWLRSRIIPLWLDARQTSAGFYGFLGEQLAGTEDIRANGAVSYVLYRFYLFLRKWRPIYGRAFSSSFSMEIVAQLLFGCGIALTLSIGVFLWDRKVADIGTIYLLFVYVNLLAQPLVQVQVELQDLQQAEACIQRIEELLQIRSELQDGIGTPLPEGALSVELENVSFGYVKDKPIIHDVTFTIQPKKILGVLGRTGSGKTTLARLLFRLYDPLSGKLLIGGVPIHQPYLHDLRRHIGMVTQDVQLFHATVRDNLTFFDRSISDSSILAALEDIGLSLWYHALPDKLDTMLGPDGTGLSAGEAQLLAFTRVFLTNPGLVILDEASSRLDPTSEGLIEQALEKLFIDHTVLIIAHRLTTVQRADHILILENGRVIEYGEREALANDSASHFFSLLQTRLEEVHT